MPILWSHGKPYFDADSRRATTVAECSPKASWQVASGHQQILRSGGLLLIFAFASIESSELRIQETLYCQLENRHAAQACGTAFRLIARDSDFRQR